MSEEDSQTGVPAEGNSPYPMGVEGGESFAPPTPAPMRRGVIPSNRLRRCAGYKQEAIAAVLSGNG